MWLFVGCSLVVCWLICWLFCWLLCIFSKLVTLVFTDSYERKSVGCLAGYFVG